MSNPVYRRGPRQYYGQRRARGWIGSRTAQASLLVRRRPRRWVRPRPSLRLRLHRFIGGIAIAGAGTAVKGPTRKTSLIGVGVSTAELAGAVRAASLAGDDVDSEELVGAPRAVLIGAGSNSLEEV